ncbi:MAG: hypothetical protein U0793_01635 [Gemmataceae bacterium]
MSLDEELVNAVREDYRRAPLNEADRAICDYVAKLTREPARMTQGDVDALRCVGFDDRAILQINLIASWFNFINRVADGLGVGKSEQKV